MAATKKSGAVPVCALLGGLLLALGGVPNLARAQSNPSDPLVAPDSLGVGLQTSNTQGQLTASDVEQLQKDLQATVPSDAYDKARKLEQEAAANKNSSAGGASASGSAGTAGLGGTGKVPVAGGAQRAGASAKAANGGLQIVHPAGTVGAGAVAQAYGGLTSFSDQIPASPPSPFETGTIGATAHGSVYLEPDALQKPPGPAIFQDPLLIEKAPPPTETWQTGMVRSGSLRGVDAKDLRLNYRQRPVGLGLNCSPPDLRLSAINDPDRPHTYRLTGLIATPTDGYSYQVHPTAQRSSFIRPTGGPALMGMTLSMQAPDTADVEPDGQSMVNELVTVAPNTLRLDVLVNNILFRRAQLYYCRIPGTLE